MVDTHNEETENSFSLALNRFADWSEDEFRSVMLGKETRGVPQKGNVKAVSY